LLHVTPATEADVTMVLYNADGGRAEMSGNGISCLAQAVVRAGVVKGPDVVVATDAGVRTVRLAPTDQPNVHQATVDMGVVKIGDDESEWLDEHVVRAVRVDVGNPHLVWHTPELDAHFDLVARGVSVNELVPEGINLELVAPGPADGEVTMRVYERGVGLTDACGTGACAVAAVALRDTGLDTGTVTVDVLGGRLTVTVTEDSCWLSGPAVLVATGEVTPSALLG
jgi:diaminopimelate epimerase